MIKSNILKLNIKKDNELVNANLSNKVEKEYQENKRIDFLMMMISNLKTTLQSEARGLKKE
jgi:hypothetical protein